MVPGGQSLDNQTLIAGEGYLGGLPTAEASVGWATGLGELTMMEGASSWEDKI
jgi:hypothetical protein